MALAARLVCLVGLALAAVAVWVRTEEAPGSYWDDGTFATMLLILLITSGLLLAASVVAPWRPLTLASSGVGLVLLGVYAFPPAISIPDQVGSLREGAWLGLAGGLVVAAGGVLAYWSEPPAAGGRLARSAATVIPRVVALAGAALVIVSIWLAAFDVDVGGFRLSESYWNLSSDVGGHHSLGIVMLILAVLVAVATVLAVVLGPRGDALALALSLVVLGFVLAFPVALAPEWSFFGAGAWLGVAGGAVLVVGSLFSLLLRPSAAAAAAEAPASVPAVT